MDTFFQVGLISEAVIFTNGQNDGILTTLEYKVIQSNAGSNAS